MQIVTPPLPAVDDPAMRAVLRDGSVATLKIADAGDRGAIRRFFHDLSPESRRKRFFTFAEPSDDLIGRLCDSRDAGRAATILVLRIVGGEARPIAVGSYISTSNGSAEAAFAVDDRYQGRGLGTILLEDVAVPHVVVTASIRSAWQITSRPAVHYATAVNAPTGSATTTSGFKWTSDFSELEIRQPRSAFSSARRA